MKKKKYQIFISSTYKDLKNERKEAINAILNMGHLPSGMELFSASNDEQFNFIKKVIDDSDYYVLILAQYYGSICNKTGISYTEMEYDYAVQKGLPILTFFADENYESNIENNDKLALFKLEAFRKKVLNNKKLAKSWSGTSDLVSSLVSSLNNAFETCPQDGWVKDGDNENLEEMPIQDYLISYYPQVVSNSSIHGNWYEKYKSGLIKQGGNINLRAKNHQFTLTFFTAFKSKNYSLFYNLESSIPDTNVTLLIENKTLSQVTFKILNIKSEEEVNINWFAIGF